MTTLPAKPTSEVYRPELVGLPLLTKRRRIARRILQGVCWIITRTLLRIEIEGRENIPTVGPCLLLTNHLGDADGVVGLAASSVPFDLMGKIELLDVPIIGRLMTWYGTIWVHRGRADRKALRAVLNGLKENRLITIAPEGRESLTGGLETGTDGAAYIALKADVPIVPVALTGTENARIYGNLRKFRRTQVTITVGEPFRLQKTGDRKADIQSGTRTIMLTLARLLPPEYRGVYRDVS